MLLEHGMHWPSRAGSRDGSSNVSTIPSSLPSIVDTLRAQMACATIGKLM